MMLVSVVMMLVGIVMMLVSVVMMLVSVVMMLVLKNIIYCLSMLCMFQALSLHALHVSLEMFIRLNYSYVSFFPYIFKKKNIFSYHVLIHNATYKCTTLQELKNEVHQTTKVLTNLQ